MPLPLPPVRQKAEHALSSPNSSPTMDALQGSLPAPLAATATLCLISSAVLLVFGKRLLLGIRGNSDFPPAVPGLPLIGNLYQLKEKKPHMTFFRWAETYGPIFSIRTGASTVVVLNSMELAKEAMVTRFSSISTRKLPKSLTLLTSNKAMVATSDYDDFHKMVKRYILAGALGANAQKRLRCHRDAMIENVVMYLHSQIKDEPHRVVKLKEGFQMELFRLAMKQAVGTNVKSIFVEELGAEISEQEIFKILVVDPMMGALDVDWRDFFPYLRWIPNKRLEKKIMQMVTRKMAVTRALINEQKRRIDLGEGMDCYLNFLLSQKNNLTEEHITSLIWESIIEASDTTMVATEWAMYELSKNQDYQEKLSNDIQEICGSERLTEEHLPQLPYLSAVFHETLRRHPPVPVIPLRYVHEDTQLGGYQIPSGTEIAINIYACNMTREDWDMPEHWNPARFLAKKYEPMDLYKTMAFGGGKRVCAGSLQAMLISCTAIGRFIQEFQWRLKEGEEENVDTVQLTTHKLHPMQAYITPRYPSASR